ncbi:hypothetical protein CDV55_102797 [Aspergillus turcosus]|uniref:Uncharacterized protein n=1 Tax=Aspergillus turcosus TaxID=1245748 RepID=A0A229YGY8_9EURO|nr:hypothetical protein CDV55_102797 [Aspergillus turcosus]RLL93891.1 hypothetical protein CFD26_101335 [Aspergillus turcosus]
MATRDDLPQPRDKAPGIPSVDLIIDGHSFRIHPDVLKEITKQLRKLQSRRAKCEEIPEHLKAYETEKKDWDVMCARELEEYRRERKAFNDKNLREMKEAYRRKKEASKEKKNTSKQ